MKSFTTPCFIRKNTKELREKLEELEYEKHFTYEQDELHLETYMSGVYSTNGHSFDCPMEIIDCSTNEPLFLAISALREDNDYMQWFTDGVGHWEQWKYKNILSIDISAWRNYYRTTPRKATVEELINHFK